MICTDAAPQCTDPAAGLDRIVVRGDVFCVEDKATEKRPREKESHSAVWAIDLAWLETRGSELLQSKNSACTVVDDSATEAADYTNRLLRETEESVIVRISSEDPATIRIDSLPAATSRCRDRKTQSHARGRFERVGPVVSDDY